LLICLFGDLFICFHLNNRPLGNKSPNKQINNMKKFLPLILLMITMSACRISYTFRSTSINYEQTPTITIRHFINQAPLVYAPLEPQFNEAMQDVFTRRTRLQIVPNSEHMDIEGEIIGWQLTPLAVQEDAFASETRLTMSVRMRFHNHVTGEEMQETISANQVFDANRMLDDVVDELSGLLITEIVDQIFNATMANW
jgi:hypothetical protein